MAEPNFTQNGNHYESESFTITLGSGIHISTKELGVVTIYAWAPGMEDYKNMLDFEKSSNVIYEIGVPSGFYILIWSDYEPQKAVYVGV